MRSAVRARVPSNEQVVERPAWSTATWPPGIDTVVAVLAILLSAGVFVDDLLYTVPLGNPILQASWAALFAFVAFWMWRRYRYDWAVWSLTYMPLMFLVVGIAVLSSFWSLDPALTFRRSVILVGTTLVGIFIGYNFSPRQMMRILIWSYAFLLVFNVIVSMAFPDYGTQVQYRVGQSFAAWHGAMGNKNSLGSIAAVAAVLLLVGLINGRVHKYLGITLFTLSLITLLMSRSAASWVVGFTGIFVVVTFATAKRLRFPAILTFFYLLVGVAIAAVVSINYIDEFVSLLGRDSTLTKRTLVWTDAVTIIGEQPWLGYGYEAVWGKGELTWLPHLATVAWAAHAHNGFLNIATQLGLPAAILAVLHFLFMLLMSIESYLKHRSPSILFAVSYLFMTLIDNIADASYFAQKSDAWILFVAVTTAAMRILYPPKHSRGERGQKNGSGRAHRRRVRKSNRSRRARDARTDGARTDGART